jgi:hypothetical protein
MTASNVDHRDVAAYSLGVLSEWESEQFEIHLAECDQCAIELEQLTMVSTLLSHVDVESLAVAEQSTQEAQVLDRMLNVVTFERRKARTRRVLAVAAGIVVLVVGVFFGVAGGSLLDRGTTNTPSANGQSPRPSSPPSGAPSASPTKGTIGINGLEVQGKNDATNVTAKLGLEAKLWGTQVSMELANVRGPVKCQLVAISKAGGVDPALSWTVTPEGYGTPEQPTPLVLDGGTAIQRDDIAKFEVRTSDGTTLVTIPVA